jgi:hypothetical protein
MREQFLPQESSFQGNWLFKTAHSSLKSGNQGRSAPYTREKGTTVQSGLILKGRACGRGKAL